MAYDSTFDPRKGARYDSSADNIIYFLPISDTHIGYEGLLFNNPYEKELEWFLDSCLSIINPSATVNTGDLTDASLWLIPRAIQLGPQQRDEWMIYDSLIENLDSDKYFDIPGNHDRYGDPNWEGSFNSTDSERYGYTRNSVLGKSYWNDTTIPVGQFAKTITSSNGDNYILIGANTNDEEGKIWFPWWFVSDNPTLSEAEIRPRLNLSAYYILAKPIRMGFE